MIFRSACCTPSPDTSRVIEGLSDLRVVCEAEDGLEAVQQALETRPNVAVLDVSMPGRTGPQAAREIHAQDERIALLMPSTAARMPKPGMASPILCSDLDGWFSSS